MIPHLYPDEFSTRRSNLITYLQATDAEDSFDDFTVGDGEEEEEEEEEEVIMHDRDLAQTVVHQKRSRLLVS